MPGAYDPSWIHKRLREVAREAKSWPAWYRKQPLTAEDAKRMTEQRNDSRNDAAALSEIERLRKTIEGQRNTIRSVEDAAVQWMEETKRLRAELAEAERDVVWAVRNVAWVDEGPETWIDCMGDKSDAGLRAAVRRARTEGGN